MRKNNRGFSLVEVLISSLIIAVLTLGVYSLLLLSLKITADNKFSLKAMEMANQKMEQIRNLSYENVGTVSGSPSGIIPDIEIINIDGKYIISTFIKYEDDEYDGTLVLGTDYIYDDYKIATVKVSWRGKYGEKNITIFSKIIPSTEETSTGNGLLKIIVVDANGNPVPNADIHIENDTHSISATSASDSSGEFRYSVPPDFEGYEITVTKPGYGVDKTYTRGEIINGITNNNPTKPHLTVNEGIKTEESFSVDLLSSLSIKTITRDLPENWQANTDTSGEAQINSRLAVDNAGLIYIVWQDYRQSSASKILAQKYSSNREAQWPNPASPDDQNISTANNTVIPDILVDIAGNLYISWHDDSVGNKEAYLVKRGSLDGSDIWGSEKKINTLADSYDQSHPRIALLENSGITSIAVVWQDNRSGDLDVYMEKFNSTGDKQWLPEKIANTNPISDGTSQYDPVLAADSSDNICIAWTDGRNGSLDVYAAKYNSDGVAQWAADNIKINTDSGTDSQYSPSIAINSSDILYIVWTDERNGNQDIYAQKYNSSGIAQWLEDLRVNIDTSSSNQYSPDIAIDPTDGEPYASWQDDRNGDLDIYATKFESYGSISSVASVPVIVVGNKKIGEDPIIYEYSEDHITDTDGNLSLTLEWDVPGYTITPSPASYTFLLSDPIQPVELSPSETREVWLYLE